MFGRKTTRDVELEDGVTIEAGAQVLVLYGSGNRDERHYADPDRFDVGRNPTDHLSFGYGTHACAGQALAKLEAQSIIAALAKRIHRFHIRTPTRHLNNTARGLESVPVTAVDLHAAPRQLRAGRRRRAHAPGRADDPDGRVPPSTTGGLAINSRGCSEPLPIHENAVPGSVSAANRRAEPLPASR